MEPACTADNSPGAEAPAQLQKEVARLEAELASAKAKDGPFGGGFTWWVTNTRALDLKVESFFFQLGLQITKRPCLFIMVPLFVNLALIAGAVKLEFVGGVGRIWVPQQGEGKRALDIVDSLWGLQSAEGDPRSSEALYSWADGGDVFQDETLFLEALAWHNALMAKTEAFLGGNKTFETWCAVDEATDGCGLIYPNALDFFEFSADQIRADAASGSLTKVAAKQKFPSAAYVPLDPRQVFGGLQFYATTGTQNSDIKSSTSFFLQPVFRCVSCCCSYSCLATAVCVLATSC